MRSTSIILLAIVIVVGCAQQSPPAASTLPAVPGDPRPMAGIRYIDVVVGGGAEMAPRQCVYTHFTGWLTDGTRFDSSRDTTANGAPGEPVSFPQGSKRVIDGWDVGFAGMRVGGRRRLFVPYQLGYGERGSPPAIPRRANLIFDVELMALADPVPRNGTASARSSSADPQCPAWRAVRGRPT